MQKQKNILGSEIDHSFLTHKKELKELWTGYIWGVVMALFNAPYTKKKLHLPKNFIPCCAITLEKVNYKHRVRDILEDNFSKNTIE